MTHASVYRRKGRAYWHISFLCPTRLRRVHEATPFRVDSPQGEKHARALAAKKSAEAVAALAAPHALGRWDSWVDAFLHDRFRNSPRTLERYLTAWAWINLWCQRRHLLTPAAVTYAHLQGFFEWRQSQADGRAVTRNTALVELRVWGALLTEAVRRGWIDRNPADRLGLQRDPPKMKPEITDGEIARIRAGLAVLERDLPLGERWMSTSFEVAIHQGCRLRETMLPLTAIDLGARTITFRAKGKRGQKNVFTTALHPGLVPLVEALQAAKLEHTCNLPANPSKAWFTFFRDHGLGNLCFHCTRVSVITRLARSGVPMAQAMRFVGHSSEQVHRIYQRLRADDLDPCLQALRGI